MSEAEAIERTRISAAEAVKAAKRIVLELDSAYKKNLQLEGIEFDEDQNRWEVMLGHDRLISAPSEFQFLIGHSTKPIDQYKRSYHWVHIHPYTSEMLSVELHEN